MPAMSIDQSLPDLLNQRSAGVARCLFVNDVDEAISAIELAAATTTSRRHVALRWSTPPRIDQAIKVAVDDLASLARSTWPTWFDQRFSESCSPDGPPDHHALIAIAQQANLSPEWIRQAWAECQHSRLPLPAGYSQAVSVKHLAQAISTEELTIVLVVDQAGRGDIRLDGLCRMAQWLAANTHAPCTLLLDSSLHGSPQLASLDYEPSFWASHSEPQPHRDLPRPRESRANIFPIIGRPHPLSPGEQKLARALHDASDLAGLFAFNHRVATCHGNTYIVDLLAANEMAIVEVDGYAHHSNRVAFRMDRQRDYELHTSGYLVLRLTHDEVIADVESCLNKIRRLIEIRQNHPSAIG